MVKRVCALQCHVGLPFRGRPKQDKTQDVQSQDMESRGAITRLSQHGAKRDHQEEFLVKRGLSPQISSRVLCTKSSKSASKVRMTLRVCTSWHVES